MVKTKFAKTLVAVVAACTVAGCTLGSRTFYEGKIGDKYVKYERVYNGALGHEPDYQMTVSFPNGETWVIIDDNMDRVIKRGDDVVLITKGGETKKYRGITPSTLPWIIEADKIYQSMREEIKKK